MPPREMTDIGKGKALLDPDPEGKPFRTKKAKRKGIRGKRQETAKSRLRSQLKARKKVVRAQIKNLNRELRGIKRDQRSLICRRGPKGTAAVKTMRTDPQGFSIL